MNLTEEQIKIINSDEDLIVEARAGTGKCLGKDTPILMYDGSIKKVQDIEINDLLMGDDSTPRKVLNVNQDKGKLFQIIPKNGESWICNDVHILTLQGTNTKKGIIRDIALNDLITESSHLKRLDINWKLFKVPVEFKEQKINIDSYLMGIWLGDGSIDSPIISNSDVEIIDYLMNLNLEGIVPKKVWNDKHNYYSISLTDINNVGHPKSNLLREEMKFFISKEGQKIIPQNYLINSRENRLKLLAGLLDTDGHYSTGGYEIIQKSKQLANDIVFLARSLGYRVSMSNKIGKIKKINFEGSYYRINIYGNLIDLPIKVERKKPQPRKQIKNPLVSGFVIKDIGEGDYYGFTLDGNGRFLLGDFTVTHNTTTLIHYALKHNDKKKLYLAFNKSIKEEAESKFKEAGVKNISILTTHGLAYKQVIKSENYLLNNYTNVFSLMKHYNMQSHHKLMTLALRRFNSFCDSSHDDITTFDFSSQIETTSGKKFYEDHIDFVNETSNMIWNDMLNKKLDCSHSFYLKKFQLDNHILNYDIIMVDECLPYHTPILLANGESLPIGKIVDEKLSLDVLTYNTETGKQESCKITNWQKNPNNRPMYRITLMFKDEIFHDLDCTYNHKIWRENTSEWIESSKLNIGDKLIFNDGYTLAFCHVYKVEETALYKHENYTYDITVENNHNFYANGILVHNCQDLNEVTYDIIKKQTCRIIVIGDSEQAIYGWRGAVDAIEKFPYARLPLTHSFRFPQEIADIGLRVLSLKKYVKENYDFSKIELVGKGVPNGDIKTKAIISRSNSALLDRLITNRDNTISPYIEGGLESLTKLQSGLDILDLYYLYIKEKDKIQSYFVKKFKNFEELEEYYQDLDDLNIGSIKSFFDKYLHRLEKELERIQNILVQDKNKSDWIYSTIHKAKGNEYDYVKILSPTIFEEGFPHHVSDLDFLPKMTLLIKSNPSPKYKSSTSEDKIIELKEYEKLSSNLITSITEYMGRDGILYKDGIVSEFKNLYSNFPNDKVIEGLDFLVNSHVEKVKKKRSQWAEELNIYYVAVTRAKQTLDYDFEWLLPYGKI